MSVSSIRTRDFDKNDYTNEEIDAMRKDASSDATLNKARGDAGLKTPGVRVRGDDKSNGELRKEWQAHDIKEAGLGSVHGAMIEGAEGTILHGLAAPFMFGYDAIHALKDAKEREAALKANHERGAMHLGMITALDLPQGYKNVEVGRWKESGTANASGASNIGTTLDTIDKKEAAVLQLHADRGMNAARAAITAGLISREGVFTTSGDGATAKVVDVEVERVLAQDPKLREKYDSDPAFRAGFDALVWARRRGAEGEYDEAIKHLESRDARYAQHSISLRG
jgi:hypothetical protein